MHRGAPGVWTFHCPLCGMAGRIDPLPNPIVACQHFTGETIQRELSMFAVFAPKQAT